MVVLVLVATGGVTAAATTAPRLTLAVAPGVVDNGGEILLIGAATCPSVVINAYTGEPRVRALGPIKPVVAAGRFTVGSRVPFVGQGPARPGLIRLYFEAQCIGSAQSAATTVLVLGQGLPPTGSDSIPLALAGASAVLGGMLLVGRARRLHGSSLGFRTPNNAR
jgi:hypothetical protein